MDIASAKAFGNEEMNVLQHPASSKSLSNPGLGLHTRRRRKQRDSRERKGRRGGRNGSKIRGGVGGGEGANRES